MKGCLAAAALIFAAFSVGLAAGGAMQRRQDGDRGAAVARSAALACHDDRVRAEALSDQCARLADHECAGPFQR